VKSRWPQRNHVTRATPASFYFAFVQLPEALMVHHTGRVIEEIA
jgi:hypothetical protein